jgi:starvation-inducible DNA-binding protein
MQSTKAKIESYPVPTQLATKTDLSSQETKAITDAVNPLIADAFALYVKTKNFHWHLYGSHFKDYHELSQVSCRMSLFNLPNLLSRYSDTVAFWSSIFS